MLTLLILVYKCIHKEEPKYIEEVFKFKDIFTFKCLSRTFARKLSNIDFFLRLLPVKVDELLMSEMSKKWGVTDFVQERTSLKDHP